MADKPRFRDRISHAWNAFRSKEVYDPPVYYYGGPTSYMPNYTGHGHFGGGKIYDKTIIVSIFNRLAIDVSLATIQHVKVDENGWYLETLKTGLNNCLTVEANIDQNSKDFLIDLAFTMFEEGVAAVVPVDTTVDITKSDSFDIKSMRVGRTVGWMPEHVMLDLYNDKTGAVQQITLPKKSVALVTNPFYEVMNASDSTLQRLLLKLRQLDVIDGELAGDKLNMIIQLPYVVKSQTQKNQAEMRRQDIEHQLTESKYGIAYADGTEKIVQLNKSLENNLLPQVEYLTKMLYSQLGLTEEILNGTANEETMLNYQNRTINPILNAICDEFERKFLTKTARTQRQAIKYYREPFALTSSEKIADLADRLTRNEILSPNEMRSVIGFKPVDDDRANELRNRNLNPSEYQLDDPVLADPESEYADGEYVDEQGGEGGETAPYSPY